MEANNRGWPREQRFEGFFTRYENMPDRFRSITEPSTGAVIRYSVSKNLYEEKYPRIRRIIACATLSNDDRPVCWFQFDLVESAGVEVSDFELHDACDSISASLERMADALIETCDADIGETLDIGPILHFHRVEVRDDLRGKGLGMTLSRYLLTELEARFEPALLVSCPHPLQFEACAPEPDDAPEEHARFEAAQEASMQKVIDVCQREIGVVRLGGVNSEYWGEAMMGGKLLQLDGKWSLH